MKTSAMTPSKYLKKEDIERDTLVTMTHLEQHDVSMADQPEEKKWILFLKELDKGMVLNTTNISLIEEAYGDETDLWVGKKIVLWVDPNVIFGKKRVGGLRVRAPRNTKPATPPPAQETEIPFPDDDADVPF